MHTLRAAFAAIILIALAVPRVDAQTTAASGTTIVVPVTAQTASFISETTVQNPNGVPITVDVAFYEANNSPVPGLRPCADAVVPANRAVQFVLATQCTLGAGSHFGVLVLTELTGTHPFYGFARVQNPQGIGFSTEGFPAGNFNDQVSHATGLKKTTAGLIYQSNCFVGSLSQPVSYTLKLFGGASGAQIGTTISGDLAAYQQVRYLDVFGPAGANAPAGNYLNVRAEFASSPAATLIGFCTVQDNTSFGADFRIAKSYGSPNAFVNGGNAFGANAVLGTTDANALDIRVNGGRVVRYEPNSISPNIIGGSPANSLAAGVRGATIAGGGAASGDSDPNLVDEGPNAVLNHYGTIGGGYANQAGAGGPVANYPFATVGGGSQNYSLGGFSTIGGGRNNGAQNNYATVGGGNANQALSTNVFVGGGTHNIASGSDSTIAGGYYNTASGDSSTVSGGENNVASGLASAVLGGGLGTAQGTGSVAIGGVSNSAVGDLSIAAGIYANADQKLCAIFSLWSADGTGMNCFTLPNIFRIGADHGFSVDYGVKLVNGAGNKGVYIGDYNVGKTITTWTGAYLSDAGIWQNNSDRAAKDGFVAVDPQAVLAQVAGMPITRWHYLQEGPVVTHIGPTAQDFHAAFGLGSDDKSIGTVDADGVALAAIQGLDAKLGAALRERDATIAAQAARQAALELQVAEMSNELADARLLRADLIAMKAALAELLRERSAVAAK